jgi:hypothetical protein
VAEVATTYGDKCAILSELWLNYKDDEEFEDFITYNDLGLPLAYAVSEGIIESNKKVKTFIEETFDLLLAGLDMEDTGFEELDDILALE